MQAWCLHAEGFAVVVAVLEEPASFRVHPAVGGMNSALRRPLHATLPPIVAAHALVALQVWLTPEEKREPQRRSMETMPYEEVTP